MKFEEDPDEETPSLSYITSLEKNNQFWQREIFFYFFKELSFFLMCRKVVHDPPMRTNQKLTRKHQKEYKI